eukprot:GHVP01002341.1.p1 GENE.GHVP01002341.1~~GHVP01002341.1.p1  ORF type:complete len:318 (-),score=34.08 GHVP01002341.1:68-1021(-)
MEVCKEAELKGHTDLVTSISTPIAAGGTTLVTGSRDKSILVWDVSDMNMRNGITHYPKHSLLGHAHTVQDVMMSGDGTFVLSGSWDKTLRLWDLEQRKTIRTFTGHSKVVTSVAFSPSDRQIVSASADKTVKLWNTLAECKYTFSDEQQHQDWVSCVRFSPNQSEDQLLCVSCGWDKMVKVWNLKDCKCKSTLTGHTQALYSVTISPDGTLCASGGKDGVAILWEVTEAKKLYHLDANCPINALCFSPSNYWLCGATDKGIKIWDLEEKRLLTEIVEKNPNGTIKECTSLSWSADGRKLFFGTRQGDVFVYSYKIKD